MRAVAGALVLLLGVPGAIGASMLGGDAELVFHFVLGASFLLFASAAFDFGLPRWLALAACGAIGLLAVIFLLQGVSDVLRAAELRRLAYDVLGQRLEKALGYAFLLWCLAIVALSSSGWTRALGAVLLAAILCVEIYSFMIASRGGAELGALKLLYLPLFVWLLLEGVKPATPARETSHALA